MTKLLILNIIIFTILGAFGGFFFKKTSEVNNILKNQYLYLGIAFYGTGAILNIIELKYLPYSIVLPLTSITYIWTILISHFLLKERINKHKILGIIFIISGVICISFS